MTESPGNPALLWDRLLMLAEEIGGEGCPFDELGAQLLSIEEGFSSMVDPVDRYAEYVAVMLCRALRQRIERERDDAAANRAAGRISAPKP